MSTLSRRLARLEERYRPKKPVVASIWYYPTRDGHREEDKASSLQHIGTHDGPSIIVGLAMPHLPPSAFGRPAVRTLEELNGLAS